jgi:hypothetical protein
MIRRFTIIIACALGLSIGSAHAQMRLIDGTLLDNLTAGRAGSWHNFDGLVAAGPDKRRLLCAFAETAEDPRMMSIRWLKGIDALHIHLFDSRWNFAPDTRTFVLLTLGITRFPATAQGAGQNLIITITDPTKANAVLDEFIYLRRYSIAIAAVGARNWLSSTDTRPLPNAIDRLVTCIERNADTRTSFLATMLGKPGNHLGVGQGSPAGMPSETSIERYKSMGVEVK